METLLHIGGTLVTIIFLGAVLYSLTSALRKKRKTAKLEKELETKEHVKVKNVHQYDIAPQQGYYKYLLTIDGELKRMPQKFTAISVALANNQPYSIYLIGFAEFDKGELKEPHYFYIQPPENNLANVKDKDVTWDVLKKADTFGEYWEAGMKKHFAGHTLVAHNAPFVMGCIAHALKVYDIPMPPMHFVDTLSIAKKDYSFSSNQLSSIADELGLEWEDNNALTAAITTGKFLVQAGKDYPMHLPTIHYINGAPSTEERWATVISTVEREECTPAEIFAPNPPDMAILQTLVDKKYIEPGETKGTYYATNVGLDFAESL